MVELSKLFVTIGAKTDQFEKGLKRVSKQMRGVALGMVAIGAGIAAALGKAVKDFAELGDQMQKMSLRTGFSTEALSELKFAAEISGASLDTLEKGVKRMASALVDADNGLLETKRAFDALGLSATALLKLSPEEQFFAITGAIGDMEDATLRAATAQDIFGRAGTQLLPLIAQGADGIEALRKEANELGIVFDQVAADAAAEFNDALTRLQGSIKGIEVAIGSELAPILTDTIDNFTESAKGIIDWTKENRLLTRTLIDFSAEMSGILIAVGSLVLFGPKVIGMVKGFGLAASTAALALVGLAAGISLIAFGVTGLIKNAEARAAVEEIEIERTKALAGETNNLADKLEDAIQRGYIKGSEATLQFITDTRALEAAQADLGTAASLTAAELQKETAALLELENAAIRARNAVVPPAIRAALFVQEILAAGADPATALLLLDELQAPGGAFGPDPLPAPESPAGLVAPDFVIQNNIMLDGEVIGTSVNEIVGEMVGDRMRIEGEIP